MTGKILLYVFLMGLALSADAFAVSITDGLIYRDIDKKKSVFIAGVFGVMQALMPLLGFWLVELVQTIVINSVGSAQGVQKGIEAGKIMSIVVAWIAFALLMFVGIKMLVEAIKDVKKPREEKTEKLFSVKETLIFGVITAIDALATGVALHETEIVNNEIIYKISNQQTIFLHVTIIMCCTFLISLAGVRFGHFFEKLLKGKYEIASIIGGSILILLAIWTILSHYLNII